MKKFVLLIIILSIISQSVCCAYAASDKFVLPLVSKSEAIEKSTNYINEYYNSLTGEIDFDNCYITYSKSAPFFYNIIYQRVINDIPFGTDCISLFVDAQTGEIQNCIVNFTEDISINTETQLISKGDARSKFMSAGGLELRYNKVISNKDISTYLTYTANDNLLVNAETGNTITLQYDLPTDGYFDIASMYEKSSSYIESYSTLLSTRDADNIARSIEEFQITDNYRTISAEYLRCLDGTYIITLTYQAGNDQKTVSLNAQNAKPVEYNDNSASYATAKSGDQSEKILRFAEKYYPEYLNSMTKYINITDDYSVFLYERQVNGIPYKSNGLYISYDNYGKLTHLSFAWDNIEFASVSNIIPLDKAYSTFFSKCDIETAYYKRENGTITPVYQKSSHGTGIIDAVTGRQLNYDGSTYYSQNETQYLDINTHYASKVARKLSDCDIYISSGSVYLGDCITQQDYLLLICEMIDGTKPVLNTTGILTNNQREMLYTYMYSKGVLDKSETEYTGYITRADAVKYFLRVLGYGTVADMSEIFISHFKDTADIPEGLIGYVELARSLGIVKGSDDGYFLPNDYITNGESLTIIYNYLTR